MSDTDDITTLAVLGERLRNVMSSVGEIKKSLDGLATRKEIAELVSRAEHSAAVVSLENRLSLLESQVRAGSISTLIDTVTKVCLSMSAIAAAGSLIYHFARAAP
jgi:hypothetical protein